MIRRLFVVAICVCAFVAIDQSTAQAQQVQQVQRPAYGASWGHQGSRNMDRFYHYPYVTYPQNYWGNEYYRSADSLYHRYPAEMRVPVYNKHWQNYYPTPRRYHWGHHFLTDVF